VTDPQITSLHHLTLITRSLERSVDFYGRTLGLESLGSGMTPWVRPGQTVIEEAPAHFFGQAGGERPILSIIHRPDAPPGRPGIGGTPHFAMAVKDRSILLQWKRHILDQGFTVNGILDRHYFQSIYVPDPDGQLVELATMGPGWTIDEPAEAIGMTHQPPPTEMVNTNRDRARIAAENWPDAVPEISDQMQIRGLHHVTAIGIDIERTHQFLATELGMRRVKRTSNFDDAASFHWYWGNNEGRPGTLVTYFERRPERERRVEMGAGQTAHYALLTDSMTGEALAEWCRSRPMAISSSAVFGPGQAKFSAAAVEDPDGQPVLLIAADRRPHPA
jgi:glyoxalase family protein